MVLNTYSHVVPRMQQQAAALSVEERQAVAQAVTGKRLGSVETEVAMREW